MAEQHAFEGFSSPNGTIVPDEFFDVLMPQLSEAELRVLLYIIRRTLGFKKNADSISLKQMVEGITTSTGHVLDRGTGLSKASAARGLKRLVARGIILAQRNQSPERGHEATTYTLRFKTDAVTPMSHKETRGASLTERQALVSQRDTQETVLQQTVQSSNIRKAAQGVDNSERAHTGQSGTRPPVRDTATETTHVATKTLTKAEAPATEEGKPTVLRTVSRGEEAGAAQGSSNGRSHGQNNGPEGIGAILSRHSLRPEESDAREAIQSYIKDIAREFGDKAKLKSSVSRAYNLYEQSGRTLHGFVDALFLARANVKERQDSTTQDPINNRMSYFFGVLADQLGLKTQEQAGEPGTEQHDAPAAAVAPPD